MRVLNSPRQKKTIHTPIATATASKSAAESLRKWRVSQYN